MEKNKRLIYAAVVLVAMFAVLTYVIVFYTPVRPRLEYYGEDQNYITAAGTVSYISYDENNTYVYLCFETIPDVYQDRSFRIGEENFRVLMERGFRENVQLGTQVEYTSATRIFWDGYSMPIVELSVDGEVLLSFEEGKENLLNSIRGD